ncbi:hypothetical protein LWC34_46250 [Kibdelosporangium philippinense]|uniref:Integral membrane protein n=1 Tax=Kibdelosporangium philippinense TaxID=211113 RepID=A0ABS8ZRA4_9PSEU|nr:hypothetical protein [Kibdelosporangium philippinense]MCE7010157.1 hypothetical protein [Kibdelosporangium philippinense]
MNLVVDVAGLLAWVAAYVLAFVAVAKFGRAVWQYVVPFLGLAVGFVAYFVIAWRFGRWPVLIVGLVLCAVAVAVLSRRRER